LETQEEGLWKLQRRDRNFSVNQFGRLTLLLGFLCAKPQDAADFAKQWLAFYARGGQVE